MEARKVNAMRASTLSSTLSNRKLACLARARAYQAGLLNLEVPFLTLPSEVRNLIYTHAFRIGGDFVTIDHDGVTNCYNETFLYYEGHRISGFLALLQTCKQVYKEAKKIFWEENIINLGYFSDFRCIRPSLASRAQNLRIYVPYIIQAPHAPFGADDNVGLDACCSPDELLDVLYTFRRSAREGTLKSIKMVTTIRDASHHLSRTTFMTYDEDRRFMNDFFRKLEELFGENGDMKNVKRQWIIQGEKLRVGGDTTLRPREMEDMVLNLQDIEWALGKVTLDGFVKEDYRLLR